MNPSSEICFVPELGSVIGFTAADLAANRRGTLTARQVVRLLTSRWAVWILGALTMVVPVTMAARWQLIAATDRLMVGGFALAFTAGGALLFWFASTSVRDAVGRRAEAWEGHASAVEESRREVGKVGEALEHHLVIGDERLTITFAQYRVIPNGREWRVFWAPRSRILLSLEPLVPIKPGELRVQPVEFISSCVMVVGFWLGPVCFAIAGIMALFGSPDWAAWVFFGFLFGGFGLMLALGVKWGLWRP